MSQIFEQTFERTLDALVARAAPGQSFEAWTSMMPKAAARPKKG